MSNRQFRNPVQTLDKYGPKPAGHSTIGTICRACKQAFKAGDYTTLVPLGPGNDVTARALAKEGLPYHAKATEIHWACATGEEDSF